MDNSLELASNMSEMSFCEVEKKSALIFFRVNIKQYNVSTQFNEVTLIFKNMWLYDIVSNSLSDTLTHSMTYIYNNIKI